MAYTGHTHSAYHPLMGQRLARMDALAFHIVTSLSIHSLTSQPAVFILMGDHGMTDDGNHVSSSIKNINYYHNISPLLIYQISGRSHRGRNQKSCFYLLYLPGSSDPRSQGGSWNRSPSGQANRSDRLDSDSRYATRPAYSLRIRGWVYLPHTNPKLFLDPTLTLFTQGKSYLRYWETILAQLIYWHLTFWTLYKSLGGENTYIKNI